jgi:hypothetical protein
VDRYSKLRNRRLSRGVEANPAAAVRRLKTLSILHLLRSHKYMTVKLLVLVDRWYLVEAAAGGDLVRSGSDGIRFES